MALSLLDRAIEAGVEPNAHLSSASIQVALLMTCPPALPPNFLKRPAVSLQACAAGGTRYARRAVEIFEAFDRTSTLSTDLSSRIVFNSILDAIRCEPSLHALYWRRALKLGVYGKELVRW